jgi:hypothetical protein
MGLIKYIQDLNRNVDLKEMNRLKRIEIDTQKQKEQQPKMKTTHCPHCGKLIEILL